MKKKWLIVTVVLVVLAAAGAAVFVTTKDKKDTEVVPTSATVEITKDGYMPSTLSVQTGATVTWKNSDDKPHTVESTPYPSHTDLPGLDSKTILPGASYSFTFDQGGSFKYYDGAEMKNNGVVQVN